MICVNKQEEEIEADKIFVTSSLAEAMYLLEQCTDVAINNVSFHCMLTGAAFWGVSLA